jgi:hypothetical protein
MSQEIYTVVPGSPRCYSCIQWDGVRSFDHEHEQVKVDAGSEGNCRVLRKMMKGSSHCENYFPLK